MVDERDNPDPQEEEKEDLFEIDATGEAVGYISLDQARVLAMQTATREPGAYGRQFRDVPMAFEVVEENETEDHYVITLSLRPQGEYAGASGQEQFFIEKEGQIAHRQVLSLPRPESRRRFPVMLVVVIVAVLGIGGAAAAVVASGALNGVGSGDTATTTPVPTVQAIPTASVAVADIFLPTPTHTPTHTPSATPVAPPTVSPTSTVEPTTTTFATRVVPIEVTVIRRPITALTPTQNRIPTPVPTHVPTITPTPTRTNTPTPTNTPPSPLVSPLVLQRGVAGVYFDEVDRQPRTGAPDSVMLVFNQPLDPDSIQPSDFLINGIAAVNTFWTSDLSSRMFIRMPFDLPEGSSVEVSLVGRITARNGAVLSNVEETIPPASTATPTPPPVFTPTPIVVPKEAVFFEDHYYLVFDFQVSWEKAVAISESENGHLVTINNARENLFVSDLARERGLGVYWIGLTDEGTEGTFRWITGEPLIYQNWASGEPNNDADNEHFVETGTDGDGRWNDRRGGKLWPFVIEYDEFGGTPPTNVPSPTPTPTPLPELPNLVPAHLTQWDAPLVTSAVKTSFLNVPPPLEHRFTAGQEIYISWVITNDSPTAVSEPFMVGILVDGNLLMKFVVPRLDSRDVYRELNHLLVIDEPGEHEIAMFIDINGEVAESDEFDNEYFIYPIWQTQADIVFVSDRDGNDEIYVMAADGTDQTRLTFEPAFDGFPAWSPDGTMIAFESERDGNNEIYVMNADGSNQRNLTNRDAFDSAPTWSPDGSRITFISDRDGDFDVFVMNADGSNQTSLTQDSAVDDFPSWFPDGSRIIFESNRDGDYEIYSMAPDGSGVLKLTNNFIADNHARVSPDGTKIVFKSDRDGNPEIYVRDLSSSKLIRLTFHDGNDFWPNWSPDSKQIVFYSDRDGANDIFVFAADGSTRAALTGNSSSDAYPHWSPK